MALTQTEVDEACRAAAAHYRALPREDAQTRFAYEVQGFVAAEANRGSTPVKAVAHIMALLALILTAQEQDEAP